MWLSDISLYANIWNGRNNFRKIELVIHIVLKLNVEDVILKIEFYRKKKKTEAELLNYILGLQRAF